MEPIRRAVKSALQITIPSDRVPIVVASMGRSGSTLVFKSVRDSLALVRFGNLHRVGRKVIEEDAWDLSTCHLRGGFVYKTHALAKELPKESSARVVFVFGPATDAALSVYTCRERYGEKWVTDHFRRMRANGTFDELGTRDVLRFEEQIDGWMNLGYGSILALRYDTLWNNVDVLSDYLGFDVTLSARRERMSRAMVNSETFTRFNETYRKLDEKIENLPDCLLRIDGMDRTNNSANMISGT